MWVSSRRIVTDVDECPIDCEPIAMCLLCVPFRLIVKIYRSILADSHYHRHMKHTELSKFRPSNASITFRIRNTVRSIITLLRFDTDTKRTIQVSTGNFNDVISWWSIGLVKID